MKNQQKPKCPGRGANRALCNCPECIRRWRETRADTTRLLSIIGPYEFKSVKEGLAL